MAEAGGVSKNVKVQIMFVIDPFEVTVESTGIESETGKTIARMIDSVKEAQEDIRNALSTLDTTQFRPISKQLPEAGSPLEKLAANLSCDAADLKTLLLFENEKPFFVCKREHFGQRGAGERAALCILYAFKYGLDKAPKSAEVNESYQKIGFKPRPFGSRVKGNLITVNKISEKDGVIIIEPKAIKEAEGIFSYLLTKAK